MCVYQPAGSSLNDWIIDLRESNREREKEREDGKESNQPVNGLYTVIHIGIYLHTLYTYK